MKQNARGKKGLLGYLADWFPFWLPYRLGALYKNMIEPFEYGFSRHRKFYNFLKESQWWPQEKIREYQNKRLRILMHYVYENVPYYHDIFNERKLKPDDVKSVDDLNKLPILTKEDIIKNKDRLISKKAQKDHFVLRYTSGSTGKPMLFYRSINFRFIDEAFTKWRLSLAGISAYAKCIRLWSRPFIENDIKDIIHHEPYKVQLSLSNIPCEKDRLDEYLLNIKNFHPVYIIGSPSFLYTLALYARDNKYNDIRFPVFISCYENLYHYQREIIEQQFRCNILRYYSSEELLVYAIECKKQEGMHIEIRKGVMEIVDENGKVLNRGQQGRIIQTGFYNYAMPLIRYDIGDIGSISNELCPCGRSLPLLKSLGGRTSEVIKYNGKSIYPATLSVVLEQFFNIKECQFIQDKKNEIKINIIKRKKYSSKDTEDLTKVLKRMIGKGLNLKINFVDDIPRTDMGKFQFIINRMKIEN